MSASPSRPPLPMALAPRAKHLALGPRGEYARLRALRAYGPPRTLTAPRRLARERGEARMLDLLDEFGLSLSALGRTLVANDITASKTGAQIVAGAVPLTPDELADLGDPRLAAARFLDLLREVVVVRGLASSSGDAARNWRLVEAHALAARVCIPDSKEHP